MFKPSSSIKISGGFPKMNDTTQYVFELLLTFKDNSKKKIMKIEDSKYSELVDGSEKILFENIKKFSIKVIQVEILSKQFELESDFKTKDEYFSEQNENIYIEFQNKNDFLYSSCYTSNFNTNTFLTPPNY
jgi:hypothetical protein